MFPDRAFPDPVLRQVVRCGQSAGISTRTTHRLHIICSQGSGHRRVQTGHRLARCGVAAVVQGGTHGGRTEQDGDVCGSGAGIVSPGGQRRRGCWTMCSPWCLSAQYGSSYETSLDPLFPGPVVREARAAVCTRSRYAEDRLAAGAFAQYVILGAGLDSFAWRRPDLLGSLRVFEVDHPASQAWKLERVRDLALPLSDSQVFVPADFEAEPVQDALGTAGFDSGAAGDVLLDGRCPLSDGTGDRVDVAHDRGGCGRVGGGVLLPGRGLRAR